MVDPFRRLLFDISKNLTKEEVTDLIFLCEVPQAAQMKIQDGKDLFKYLEETGVINEEKINSLKKILILLRPRRQDLLDLVEKKYPREDNQSFCSISSFGRKCTISTIASDTSGYSLVTKTTTTRHGRQDSNEPDGPQKYFIVDCYCIKFDGCSITKPFCCCYGTTMFLLFFLVISVTFWFSGRPKTVYSYLSAKEYRKDIGFVVVSVLSFLLIIVIFPYLIRKHAPKIFSWCNRKTRITMQRRRSLRNQPQLLCEGAALSPTLIRSAKTLAVDSPTDQREHGTSL